MWKYNCGLCKKYGTNDKSRFDSHMSRKIPCCLTGVSCKARTDAFTCTDCKNGDTFANSGSLNKHIKKYHSGDNDTSIHISVPKRTKVRDSDDKSELKDKSKTTTPTSIKKQLKIRKIKDDVKVIINKSQKLKMIIGIEGIQLSKKRTAMKQQIVLRKKRDRLVEKIKAIKEPAPKKTKTKTKVLAPKDDSSDSDSDNDSHEESDDDDDVGVNVNKYCIEKKLYAFDFYHTRNLTFFEQYSILTSKESPYIAMLDYFNLNPSKPSFHNMKLDSKNAKQIDVYDGEKWIKLDIKEALKNIIKSQRRCLFGMLKCFRFFFDNGSRQIIIGNCCFDAAEDSEKYEIIARCIMDHLCDNRDNKKSLPDQAPIEAVHITKENSIHWALHDNFTWQDVYQLQSSLKNENIDICLDKEKIIDLLTKSGLANKSPFSKFIRHIKEITPKICNNQTS